MNRTSRENATNMPCAAVLAACSALVSSSGAAIEGEDRWRFADMGDRMALYIADTDGGTDNIGSPAFSCRRASGVIEVKVDMDEQEREVFADLIRRNKYPLIKFAGSNDATLPNVSYSEMTGWQFAFTIDANSQAFATFKNSGVFQFTIGDVRSGIDFTPGLENVAKFQDACRKPGSR